MSTVSSNDETRILTAEEIAERDARIRAVVALVLIVLGATLATVGTAFLVSVWAGMIVLGAIVLVVGVFVGMT